MPAATTSNMDAFLKIRYPNGIAFQGVKSSKFWSLCPKNTSFTGNSRLTKVAYSPGTGGSSDFAKALANRGPQQVATFTITRKRDYVVGALENEIIEASKGSEGAIQSVLEDELDKKGIEFGMRLSRRLMGNAGGSLGRISATATTTITLTSRADARNFYIGMVCTLASDDGTGTSPSAERAGTITVSKVNAATGVITFAGNVTAGIPAAATSDYIFSEGDYGQAPTGVFGWVPLTAPTAGESFLGVDRTIAMQPLSGTRYTGGGRNMIEVVNLAASEGFIYGAEGEYLFTSGADFARLQNTLEGKACMCDVSDSTGKASFKAIELFTTYGSVKVMPEPYFPEGSFLLTKMSDWQIHSLGDLPHFSDTGHGKLQQESAADARQFRLVGYWNLECKNPGNCTIGTW